MCGRKTLTQSIEKITRDLSIDKWERKTEYRPSYNISPGQLSPIILQDKYRVVKKMKWGLIPSWAKDKSIGYKMINARAETLTKKSSFQGLITKKRCVVISDGYYEWKKEGKRKIPYYIRCPNNQLLPLAGLWTSWINSNGNKINSYTIITTKASAFVYNVHHRMPVILNSDSISDWLDITNFSTSNPLRILKSYTDKLEIYTVSDLVNSTINDSPNCIEPLTQIKTLNLF